MRRKAEKEVGAEPPADTPGPRGKSELARSFRGWGDNAARRHLADRSRPKRSTKHDLVRLRSVKAYRGSDAA
ncbi:hypothetical protein Misp02_62370 [Microtetraspora sp. NBRC 16547]|nr:hypothetical protein Misp02_62370 [Microtetraspora sp. NBRC 16547]